MRRSTGTDSMFLEDTRLCCYPKGTTLGTSTNFSNRRTMAAWWIIASILLILGITFVISNVSKGSGSVVSNVLHRMFKVAKALEECPIGSVMYCPQNKICITDNQRCDRFQDCPDGRDETNCTCRYQEFQCRNSVCLSKRFLCDGVQDCPLNDDESDGHCGTCPEADSVRCRKTRKCIKARNICDGKVDCPGVDDERNCAEIAKSSELTLRNRGSRHYQVCASNWNPQLAENLCKYMGYKNVSSYWTLTKPLDSYAIIDGFGRYKYQTIIKSSIVRRCSSDEVIKVECTAEEACGRRKYNPTANSYIINGKASSPGQWPWHARLSCEGSTCGSSILNQYWLITAAHCLFNKSGIMHQPDHCIVSTGSIHVYDDKWITYRVKQFVVHPYYYHRLIVNDLALLKVATRIVFSPYVQPVCLPFNYSRVHDFRTCVSIGFGKTAKGMLSPTLLHSKMMEYERQFCSPTRLKAETEICIGTRPGLGNANICMGDSGGSFACQRPNEDRWFIMGISSYVSAKVQQAEEHELCQASFAARVSYFLEWIHTTISTS